MSSPTLGTYQVATATLYVERYAVAHADIDLVSDGFPAEGSSQTLTIGTLALVGSVTSSGTFGGQAKVHWTAGTGGWSETLPARPYHDDGGIMLSKVLSDLERDAATAAGASPLGTAIEIPDVRLDAAGSWLRPSAPGRDLLDALALAAGQPPGAWWVAKDGSTHLGPRPASSVQLSDLTITPFDPALVRGVVRIAGDDFAPLLPGASITAPGLSAPLPVGALIVHVDGEDIWAEVWGEASHAELFARDVRHVMAGQVTYLPARPYTVTSVSVSDGRVAVAAPPGSPMPDAPLLGHAPGIPGASFTLAPGAAVLVSCVDGSPGKAVCTAYPQGGVLPAAVGFNASGTVTVGGDAGTGSPFAMAIPLISWITGTLLPGLASHSITIAPPGPSLAATKANGV